MADYKLQTLNVSDASFVDYFNIANRAGISIGKLHRELALKSKDVTKAVVDGYDDEGYVKDAEAGLGYFPLNAFDLIDRTVHLPLTNFFVQDYIPIRTGGGVAERLVAYRNTSAPTEMQQASGGNNAVPLVGGSFQQYSVPVRGYEAGILIKNVDLMKAQQGNFSFLELLEKSLRESYWFTIERRAFFGNKGVGGITTASPDFVPGLLNLPVGKVGGIVEAQIKLHEAVPEDKALEDMDLSETMEIFRYVITKHKHSVLFNKGKYINHIALYPEIYDHYVATPAVIGTVTNGTVFQSMMDYMKANLKTLLDGGELQITPLPYLSPDTEYSYVDKEVGTNSTGRVVLYRQNEDAFYFGIPLPMTLSPLLFSVTENGYRKNGLTFMTDGILVHYPETIWYLDNTASGE